jgi:tetratricopeptide (TPR) repeat protein
MPVPQAPANVLDKYKAEVAAHPESAEAHSNLAWGYYGQRQYAEAIQAFNEALRLDRNYIDAHYGLGMALKESGAGRDAVPSFETVVHLAPQLENQVRGQMLVRLAHGHINQISSGDWDLDQEMRRREQ